MVKTAQGVKSMVKTAQGVKSMVKNCTRCKVYGEKLHKV